MRSPDGHRAIGGATQLRYAVLDPQPARVAVALVRQADAPGVDEAHPVHHPIVLLVGVPGDDQPGVDPTQRLGPPLRGRDPGEKLLVAARGGVAEEDAVHGHGQRQVAQRPGPIRTQLRGGEGGHLRRGVSLARR
jgi:hypothetical protein